MHDNPFVLVSGLLNAFKAFSNAHPNLRSTQSVLKMPNSDSVMEQTEDLSDSQPSSINNIQGKEVFYFLFMREIPEKTEVIRNFWGKTKKSQPLTAIFGGRSPACKPF